MTGWFARRRERRLRGAVAALLTDGPCPHEVRLTRPDHGRLWQSVGDQDRAVRVLVRASILAAWCDRAGVGSEPVTRAVTLLLPGMSWRDVVRATDWLADQANFDAEEVRV